MKPITYITFLLAIIFTACSKKNTKVDVDPGGPVTINGTSYPTVKIGSQTWTSVNYNGPGGMNYNGTANDPVYGKLYTYTEAEAISLPAGWHLSTESDFTTLFSALGVAPAPTGQNFYLLPISLGQQLMSTTTWYNPIGNNNTGFNAVAAGIAIGGFANYKQFIAEFLTSSKFPNGNNVSFAIDEHISPTVVYLNSLAATDVDGGSVRFVKN